MTAVGAYGTPPTSVGITPTAATGSTTTTSTLPGTSTPSTGGLGGRALSGASTRHRAQGSRSWCQTMASTASSNGTCSDNRQALNRRNSRQHPAHCVTSGLVLEATTKEQPV